MSRELALAQAAACFDDGRLRQALARRIACPTESPDPARAPRLDAYLREQLAPALEALGFTWRVLGNPVKDAPPFLIAERREVDAPFTVLSYGHGDVVRGQARAWRDGLDPWRLTIEGDHWYGRGTADNKGQHSINLAALAPVPRLKPADRHAAAFASDAH
jgi:acetylornithine deacetylase/succinyl-diaminopimelate desuccinylase-like protein